MTAHLVELGRTRKRNKRPIAPTPALGFSTGRLGKTMAEYRVIVAVNGCYPAWASISASFERDHACGMRAPPREFRVNIKACSPR
jgi:hypothetical protein